jgi:hypothetical protein
MNKGNYSSFSQKIFNFAKNKKHPTQPGELINGLFDLVLAAFGLIFQDNIPRSLY